MVVISILVVLAAGFSGCSGNKEVDGSTGWPEEISREIPSGSVVSSNGEADFNGDGEADYVVAYGPIVDNKNTQLGLITYVDGRLETFNDPVGLQFRIDNVNSDSVDDLAVWLGNPAVWRKFVWAGDAWSEVE